MDTGNRSLQNNGCQRILSLYCSLCGELLNDNRYRHTCNREEVERASSPTRENIAKEQFQRRRTGCRRQRGNQDPCNRCVTFDDKSCNDSQYCACADRSKQESTPTNRETSILTQQERRSNSQSKSQYQSSPHSCGCAKCQAKETANYQTENTSRSMQGARQSLSWENISQTMVSPRQPASRGRARKSMPTIHQSASLGSIENPVQDSRQPISRNSTNMDCFRPPLSSTRAFNYSESNEPIKSHEPMSSCQRCRMQSTNNSQCQCRDKPSTSTNLSCNKPSISPSTRQSLRSTELNNTLFHPTPSYSSVARTEFDSDHEENTSKDKQSLLVEDTYMPGLIEDCVAGRKDFNAISFGIFFENSQQIPKDLPTETPMTLLEAFYNRIQNEREHMSDALNCKSGSQELNVESIDLYFSYKPQTELNKALSSLFKAEVLFGEHQSVSQDGPPYDIEVEHSQMPLVGGCPITVDIFTGTTKPKQSSPLPSQKREVRSTKKKREKS